VYEKLQKTQRERKKKSQLGLFALFPGGGLPGAGGLLRPGLPSLWYYLPFLLVLAVAFLVLRSTSNYTERRGNKQAAWTFPPLTLFSRATSDLFIVGSAFLYLPHIVRVIQFSLIAWCALFMQSVCANDKSFAIIVNTIV